MDYKSKRWIRIRRAILARDGYMCQESKRFGKNVPANTVHHIFPADEFPQYAFAEWNLISLSAKVHDEMHDRNSNKLTQKGLDLQRRTARQHQFVNVLNL